MSDPFSRNDDSWHSRLRSVAGDSLPDGCGAHDPPRPVRPSVPSSVAGRRPRPAPEPNEAKRVLVAIPERPGPNFTLTSPRSGFRSRSSGRRHCGPRHVPGGRPRDRGGDAGRASRRSQVGPGGYPRLVDRPEHPALVERTDGFNGSSPSWTSDRALPGDRAAEPHPGEACRHAADVRGPRTRAVAERLSVRTGDSILVLGTERGTSFPGAQIAKSISARASPRRIHPELARELIRRDGGTLREPPSGSRARPWR